MLPAADGAAFYNAQLDLDGFARIYGRDFVQRPPVRAFLIGSIMPIYAYKCDACGHTLDALQKMSDAPLTDCPKCGKPALHKQLTAAGFQLKGSGWYATDFKGSAGGAAAGAAAGGDSSSSDSKSASPPAACGASCACH